MIYKILERIGLRISELFQRLNSYLNTAFREMFWTMNANVLVQIENKMKFQKKKKRKLRITVFRQ
jgi:hypothetical protein